METNTKMGYDLGSYEEYKRDKVAIYIDSIRQGWRHFWPSLQIGITDECFNNCPMCGHWKRKNKMTMDLESLITLLSKGKALGLDSVCYSGGDPMAVLGKYWHDVIRWHEREALPYGMVIAGYLNGLDPELLTSAKWIRCSLDTVDKDLYKKIRGGTITLYQVLRDIRAMVVAGVNVELDLTMHKLNIHNIAKVVERGVNLGVKRITIKAIRKHSNMGWDKGKFYGTLNELGDAAKLLEKAGISNNIKTFRESYLGQSRKMTSGLLDTRCWMVLLQSFVDANGKFYHCCTTAGDTESNSRLLPYRNGYADALRFHNISLDRLPHICKNECILRHTITNRLAEELNKEVCFF